ncbi:hypothetical protein [Oceanobacillus alkalisoli]|uniref:hypothetical protein n=1 Tax=Oceanobacillus alkalisoli TaxID=2925113 RepID=UPI001F119ADC|nr:hypothetical protein [Oceanobacillus alkalisoli]MCF3944855.1 hypothetical protein [Oceanobacillus alkalisoli]
MSEELNDLIHKANIPEQLKTYFRESNEAKLYLNVDMLSEIEELYTFYNALYYFDETEFSSYTISSLKRGSEVVAYYYYLKKILDSNLELISKDQRFYKNNKSIFDFKIDRSNLDKMFGKVSREFAQNVDYFYKNQYDEINILKTYLLLGKLELISSIIDDEYYSDIYNSGRVVIANKIEELDLKFYIRKHND